MIIQSIRKQAPDSSSTVSSWNPANIRKLGSVADPEEFTFGHFRLRPCARLLILDGKPICLGSRSFDLLVLLVRRQGEVVSKDDIVRFVWPTTTVEESNLRFQVASLRKSLGCERDLIKTIPGRGYFFAVDGSCPSPPAPKTTSQDDQGSTAYLSKVSPHTTSDEPFLEPDHRKALEGVLQLAGKLVATFGSIEAALHKLDDLTVGHIS